MVESEFPFFLNCFFKISISGKFYGTHCRTNCNDHCCQYVLIFSQISPRITDSVNICMYSCIILSTPLTCMCVVRGEGVEGEHDEGGEIVGGDDKEEG